MHLKSAQANFRSTTEHRRNEITQADTQTYRTLLFIKIIIKEHIGQTGCSC